MTRVVLKTLLGLIVYTFKIILQIGKILRKELFGQDKDKKNLALMKKNTDF